MEFGKFILLNMISQFKTFMIFYPKYATSNIFTQFSLLNMIVISIYMKFYVHEIIKRRR